MIHPSATYRVQLNKNFTFKHLDAIIDYLYSLGISTIYASPIFKAMKGSDHGYDVVEPNLLNEEIGTIDELRALSKKIKAKGFSWIQDIVPNHMSFISANYRLWDVLERGKISNYAHYFDIDWQHPQLMNKILLPFLEAELKWCIENNKIKLHFSDNGFELCYYEHTYPLNAESYETVFVHSTLDKKECEHLLHKYISQKNTGYQEWKAIKKNFIAYLSSQKAEIEKCLEEINNNKDLLMQITDQQHYQLAWYEISGRMINYRRFFTINDLICLRMEDESVFKDYHRLIKQLYDEDLIQGVRIDHIDGLMNPATYIDRLRSLLGKDCYIIAEKILEIKEQLPPSFDIQGTSGYEFLSYINQVLTDTKGSEKLISFYNKLVPEFSNYYDVAFDRKFFFLEKYMQGEWDNLLRLLLSLNIIDNHEINHSDLKNAIGVLMAAFPVYRIYINEFPLDNLSKDIVAEAFKTAKERFLNLLQPMMALEKLFDNENYKCKERLIFLQRLMQFTGPLAAKGVEDTTFYLYNPLISHNEVGDLPCVLGITIDEFHTKMKQRQQLNPLSLNCTSTHDTKRGEDARIRINVLSEFTEEWIALVPVLQKMNAALKKKVNDIIAPLVNDEYFLYQSIVGSLPENIDVNDENKDRLKGFFLKALRESKFISTHTQPNNEYEQAGMQFIDRLFEPQHLFLQTIIPFIKKLKSFADIYTLSQVIIKATAPGIPDFYQGCELWNVSYVDPDNRRQVDYDIRKKMMNELLQKEIQGVEHLFCWMKENKSQGYEKLFATRSILQYRRKNNRLFIEGDYIPLEVKNGNRKAIAYARKRNSKWLLVVVPTGIVEATHTGWKNVEILLPADAPSKWKNIFTHEQFETNTTLSIDKLFSKFPVAVLENVSKNN